jgi:hypothetical protein
MMSLFITPESTRWKRQVKRLDGRLNKVGLLDHAKIDYSEQGFKNFVFGCRTGPSEPQLEVLCHDLGHVLEFGSRLITRRTKYGCFRFIAKGKFVFHHYVFEPTTTKIIERECRAVAYSVALMRSMGVRKELNSLIYDECSSFEFLPDFLNVPGNSKEDRIQWCIDYTASFYIDNINVDSVICELKNLLKKVYKNESRLSEILP